MKILGLLFCLTERQPFIRDGTYRIASTVIEAARYSGLDDKERSNECILKYQRIACSTTV